MRLLILAVMLLVLGVTTPAANVPLKNPVLQSDLNGGGYQITNVTAVLDPSGNPLTGGGSGSGNIFQNTNTPVGTVTTNGATVGIGTNLTSLASVSSVATVSNSVFVTNAVSMGGVLYSTLDAALSNSYAGATLKVIGDVVATNHLVLSNSVTLDITQGRILNYYTNLDASQGINLLCPGTGSSIIGGVITNCITNAYQSCIGIDSRQGDGPSTNFTVRDVKLYGNTDVLFFYISNYVSGTFVNVESYSRFDALVSAFTSSGKLTFKRCKFYSDGLFAAGGVSRAAQVQNGNYDFFNCEFTIDNGIGADPVCFKSTTSGALTTTKHYPTNQFFGCVFSSNSTNTSSYLPLFNSYGNTTSQSRNDLYGCTMLSTNGYGFLQPRGTLGLWGCTILPNTTLMQVSNNIATSTVLIQGGNLSSSRMDATAGTNYWQGDIGMAAGMVPNGWFTNLTVNGPFIATNFTQTNVTLLNSTLNGITSGNGGTNQNNALVVSTNVTVPAGGALSLTGNLSGTITNTATMTNSGMVAFSGGFTTYSVITNTGGMVGAGNIQLTGFRSIGSSSGSVILAAGNSSSAFLGANNGVSAPVDSGGAQYSLEFPLKAAPVTSSRNGMSLGTDGTNIWVVLQNAGGTKITNKVTLSAYP